MGRSLVNHTIYETMAEKKSSIKSYLRSIKNLFQKDSNKEKRKKKINKENEKRPCEIVDDAPPAVRIIEIDPFLAVLDEIRPQKNDKTKQDFTKDEKNKQETIDNELSEKFDKLEIQRQENLDEFKSDDDDDLDRFTIKEVEEVVDKTTNINTQLSQDSGYAENNSLTESNHENDDNGLIQSFNSLAIEKKDKTKDQALTIVKDEKKLTGHFVKRGHTKKKTENSKAKLHPYSNDDQGRKINNIHLSGGRVIEYPRSQVDKIDISLQLILDKVGQTANRHAEMSPEEQNMRMENALDFITEESKNSPTETSFSNNYDDYMTPPHQTNSPITFYPSPSHHANGQFYNETSPLSMDDALEHFGEITNCSDNYNAGISPSCSRTISPYSETLKPFVGLQSTEMNQACNMAPYRETGFGGSPQFEESACTMPYADTVQSYYLDHRPTIVDQSSPPLCLNYAEASKVPQRVDTPETKSRTKKQFKDMQKELVKEFLKKECCQKKRTPCKDIFQDYLQRLDIEKRKILCLDVVNLDLKKAYGILRDILYDLSRSNDNEDVKFALFALICERVLAKEKTLFVKEFGLDLLKIAVLVCPHRPLLTRYLVQCIRAVTRSEEYSKTPVVFTEVDARGDTLLTACVREGDRHADVLAELVCAEHGDVPLFDVNAKNSEGYTALHVCCAEHGASTPRAHTLHVLLEHARADIWQEDTKGGETPLHLAVNSANCDLNFILIYFQSLDGKEWYNLAHVTNKRCINSPLDYAKLAMKTRATYPFELINFFQRCRKPPQSKDDTSLRNH